MPDAAAATTPGRGEEQDLRAEIIRLNKIVKALVNRAERSMNEPGSDFGLFQTAVMLEDQVRERTQELEAALHENEKINRALEREREAQKTLIRKLELAMDQLVQIEKLAALGSLVAGVAHELNTPLGNSLTVATTLKEVIADFMRQFDAGQLRKQALLDFVAHCDEAAGLIEKNSRRAADLIGNFKQVAVDQTSMRRRRFDLRQTLDEVLSALLPKLKHTRHELVLAVPSGIVLDSYPGPIEQIVSNLFSNSLLHGFEGINAGHIRIEAETLADDQLVLRYTDDGVGMSEAVAKRVFDPFFTTKLGSGGSGLGLYIAYNLATAVLGGTISLSSAPGQGVRFELLLPRVTPVTPAVRERSYAI